MTLLIRQRLGAVIIVGMLTVACGRRDEPETAVADRAVAETEPREDAVVADEVVDDAAADSAKKLLELDRGKPMNISVQVDEGIVVSDLIGPDGGTLSVSGADSTRFTLEIPKHALLRDTLIEMTPITSLSGLRFSSGLVGAVRLEPDGLGLAAPAVLTIEPAQPVPVQDQIAFGSGSGGQDVHLVPLAPGQSVARLQLLHFSTNGSAKPAPGSVQFEGGSIKWEEGFWPTPKTPQDRYSQAIARLLAELQMLEALGYEPDSQTYQEVYRTAVERVRAARFLYVQYLMRRLRAAEADCADYKQAGEAYAEYLAFVRMPQLVAEIENRETELDQLAARVLQRCARQALERCRAGEVFGGMLMFKYREMYLAFSIDGPYTNEEWGELEKCQPKWGGVITYKHSADATVEDFDGEWADLNLGLPLRDYGLVGTYEVEVKFVFRGGMGFWYGKGKFGGSDSCHNVKSTIAGSGEVALSVSDGRSGSDWDPHPGEDLPRVSVVVESDGTYQIYMESGDLTGKAFFDSKNPRRCAPSGVAPEKHRLIYHSKGKIDPRDSVISGRVNIPRHDMTLIVTWDLFYNSEGRDK
jgi:hypothetical protein